MKINYSFPQCYDIKKQITFSQTASANKPQKNSNNDVIFNTYANYNRLLTNESFKRNMISFQGVERVSNDNLDTQRTQQIKGCLLGGAVGDALGAKIEAYTYDRIKEKYGESGLHYIPKTSGVYQVTDDTQMSLFTIEALLKSYLRNHNLETEPSYSIIYDSYLDWYSTQTKSPECAYSESGLLGNPAMYHQRGPGYTCMTALKEGSPGTIENPVNNSYGNGGIMRSAPIGLLYKDPELAFTVAAKSTALTHGHPDAYLAAGCFAAIISNIMSGNDLETAINVSKTILKQHDSHEYVLENIDKALELSKEDNDPVETIEKQFGKGANAAETLGIALYSVLRHPDNYKKTIITAVNHSGDSDTTGAVAGNICGAYIGINKMPRSWIENIEHSSLLDKYAKDIYQVININSKKSSDTSSSYQTSIHQRWDDDKFV
ncbi:MAG: ADP-ribosylglycohydrolase family protein [Candidatus Gastranaerophilales bacterium]|nr:ADP-ribosylglycohydrolase family protein [Candidatus Gastranaerophilales bacterium]